MPKKPRWQSPHRADCRIEFPETEMNYRLYVSMGSTRVILFRNACAMIGSTANREIRRMVDEMVWTIMQRAEAHQQLLLDPKVKELVEVHKDALVKGLMKARKWDRKKAGV